MAAKKVVKKSKAAVKPKKAVVTKKKVVTKKAPAKKVIAKKAIKKKVDWKPKGYAAVTPYLIASPASDAINFYKKVFGAKVTSSMVTPHGQIAHAELMIGDSHIMLADACAEMNALGPESYGGSPVSMHLYVKDADAVFAAAVKAGATILEPVEDKFYGDRHGLLLDPFGHTWCVSTHIEDVSPAEMKKRMAKFTEQ
jgi:PhnB protein